MNTDMQAIRIFRVTSIENPTEFSVEEYEERPGQGLTRFGGASWSEEDLEIFYDNTRLPLKYSSPSTNLQIGEMYAWKNPDTSHWERVLVVELGDVCGVDRVDKDLMSATTEMNKLHELYPQFKSSPGITHGAYLVHIVPTLTTYWEKESIDGFAGLVKDKILFGIVVSTKVEGTNSKTTLGLVLLDKYNPAAYTLNAQMCAQGFAEPSGVFGGRNNMDFAAGVTTFEINNFKDYLVRIGREPIVIEPFPIFPPMLTGDLDQDFIRVSEFVGMRNAFRDAVTVRNENLPHFFGDKLGMCNIIRIISPGCLYVQMVDKLKDLELMMRNMALYIQVTQRLAIDLIPSGMFVAVLRFHSAYESGTWHRAVVKKHLPGINIVKVLLIDLGVEATSPKEHIRILPHYFERIPSFCQRVHFAGVNLRPADSIKWCSNSKDTIRRFITQRESTLPIYYFWKPKSSEKIDLDEFDHELQFNNDDKKWEKGIPRNNPEDCQLSGKKEELMLKNLFCSMGVDIAYQELDIPSEGYTFTSISDVLVKRGLASIQ